MRNIILNITADGTWQTLGAALGFPERSRTVGIQARTAVDVLYRWHGQTTYWTIKAGTDRVLWGEFWPGALEIQAATDTIIEIEISTQLTI
jgi:hypothetical protein